MIITTTSTLVISKENEAIILPIAKLNGFTEGDNLEEFLQNSINNAVRQAICQLIIPNVGQYFGIVQEEKAQALVEELKTTGLIIDTSITE